MCDFNTEKTRLKIYTTTEQNTHEMLYLMCLKHYLV